MQSNGGLMPAAAAAETPMHIIESGPAAGVVGAQALARRMDQPKLITFDMGGTTAKASIVEDGEVSRASEYQVGGGIMLSSRLLTGLGLSPAGARHRPRRGRRGRRLHRVDRRRRRAAGGAAERRRVSRARSATTWAATEPTITDANLILGYINPAAARRRGGEAQCGARARGVRGQGRASPSAWPLAEAGSRRPPDRGVEHDARDPRGVERARARPARAHAVRLRRQRARLRRRHGRGARDAPHRRPAGARASSPRSASSTRTLSTTTCGRIAGSCATWTSPSSAARGTRMEAEALTQLAADGFRGERARVRRSADLRYQGQSFELTVPAPPGAIDAAGASASWPRPSAASTSAPTGTGPARTSRWSWSACG